MDTAKRLDGLYNVMQSVEAKLGGGEGVEGIYGSITQTGMQRIFESMRHNCGLDSSSVLVDIGAGLGRPLLHALVSPGIRGSFGVELDHVKVAKANAFLSQTLHHLNQRGVAPSGSLPKPRIDCTSVEKVASLEPATHAYSFWEGVPQEGKDAFGRLFARARTLKGVAVVQRSVRGEDPAHMMLEHGFGPLLLIANFPVKMSGDVALQEGLPGWTVAASSHGQGRLGEASRVCVLHTTVALTTASHCSGRVLGVLGRMEGGLGDCRTNSSGSWVTSASQSEGIAAPHQPTLQQACRR